MTVSKSQLLQARLQGIRTTLDRAPAKEKSNQASTGMAKEVNEIVGEIKKEYPELADSLPKPINSTGPFRRMGKSDATYLDVEAVCEQILNLLRLVEE